MPRLTEAEIAAMVARSKRAFTEVVEISKNSDKNFRMSIPVQESDSDRVLVAVCNDTEKLAAALCEAYDRISETEHYIEFQSRLIRDVASGDVTIEKVASENQKLRDETRWRLPDADGEWKELPLGFQQEVDLTVLSPEFEEYDNKDVVVGWWDEVMRQWRHIGDNAHVEESGDKVLSWRPRAAPYTPAADAGETP